MTRIVVVWLHVLAAAVWLGGLAFAVHLVLPAILRGERAGLDLLRRARVVAWAALALLAVTGVENLRHVSLDRPWVAAKLLLLLALLPLAAHRDFTLVPRAAAAIERGVDPRAALATARWLDRLVLLLGVALVFLGLGIARGR